MDTELNTGFEDEFENLSKVYISVDEANHITGCEGGYTMSNIKNIEDWILIDEGTGDKYNLCQSHYFDLPLVDNNGCHNYIYENNAVREATEEEKEAEIIPVDPQPSWQDTMEAQIMYTAIMTDTLIEEV